MVDLPENLKAAQRAIADKPFLRIHAPWAWNDTERRWVLHCQLIIPQRPNSIVPASSDWFVLADENYPEGAVTFFPSKENGLTQTFSHQSYNGLGEPTRPWRTGKLCLSTAINVLNRHGLDTEPPDVYHRLSWHFERAKMWLEAADRDTLVSAGDPFELPQLPQSAAVPSIAFAEDEATWSQWLQCQEQAGLVSLAAVEGQPNWLAVKAFKSHKDIPLVRPAWGSLISKSTQTTAGVWIRLESCPVLPPWQAPGIWKELLNCAAAAACDLKGHLKSVAPRLRDGRAHFALIGFPVPRKAGGISGQMHWFSLKLPVLSSGTRTADGFRPNETGYWIRDRTELLADSTQLAWHHSENWAPHELSTRGHLPASVTRCSIVIIGVGALGSLVAELLVRAGVFNMTVIDEECLSAGNLARHTLLLSDICASKATRLACHLNGVSPHANVTGEHASYPEVEDKERIENADVIIDCTASDEVLSALARQTWSMNKHLVSFSMGLESRRLFCFSVRSRRFPVDTFRELCNPWLLKEQQEFAGYELPREGVGCWHPVFPARADDVALMAATAVKDLEQVISSDREGARLAVYEQLDNSGFAGLTRTVQYSDD